MVSARKLSAIGGVSAIIGFVAYRTQHPGKAAPAGAPHVQPAQKPADPPVHPDRAAMIERIQKTPGVTWKAAANPRFASRAPGASKSLAGLKKGWKASLKEAVEKGEVVPSVHAKATNIPESFDAAEHWPECSDSIGNIRDQSNCGCCWAFSAVGAASDRMCIQTGKQIPLSAQDTCFNAGTVISDGCNGGMLETSWRYYREGTYWPPKPHGVVTGSEVDGSGAFGTGWCSKFSLPHCHHHGPIEKADGTVDPYPEEGSEECPSFESPAGPTECDDDAYANHSNFEADKYVFEGKIEKAEGEEKIQLAIMAGGPMQVAYTVYEDFENYDSGIYSHIEGEELGGHAVKVVGWGVEHGVKYWKVANSWNPYWGEQGYFRILRGTNDCGIEDVAIASAPAPDATWRKKHSMSEPVAV